MSPTYADAPGKKIISPNVQMMTVAPTDQNPVANVMAPNPTPTSIAPKARALRWDQCVILRFRGISMRTIRTVLKVKRNPNAEAGWCKSSKKTSGTVDEC